MGQLRRPTHRDGNIVCHGGDGLGSEVPAVSGGDGDPLNLAPEGDRPGDRDSDATACAESHHGNEGLDGKKEGERSTGVTLPNAIEELNRVAKVPVDFDSSRGVGKK